jgi:Domain of unknown function DUF29
MTITTHYDEDFVAWSQQQAEALRAAARGGSNQVIDWQNLAEEIEGLGKSRQGMPSGLRSGLWSSTARSTRR